MALPGQDALAWFRGLALTERDADIAAKILKEVPDRLGFLASVGLDYLTLDRTAGTLSGGESQRIRLATQIGSKLMGVLYVLDEPSIGLHQRDNRRLLGTLQGMRDLGNTVLVVEHDEETMREADCGRSTSAPAPDPRRRGGGCRESRRSSMRAPARSPGATCRPAGHPGAAAAPPRQRRG